MSNNVDRRIVEMRFDNQDFEKNVSQTLVSLETLQKALEMQSGTKGLDNIRNAVSNIDLSNLESGVASVENRFSALGIVGMRVLQNLTDTAMSMLSKLGGTFLGPLFSGGKQRAMNMAQAKFMFSGLGKTAKEIGSVGDEGTIMDNLYKSVEGTFYSLDKAALIGSQLMAAGVDYKTELTDVMKSIAGVASVYNMDYQRVGQLFTQIKAGNKLSGREVESFMTSGLNVYATIADYLNSIGDGAQYTQEQVKEMVTKGEIDFATFTKAMATFASQAQKSKQLFSGAFEDMAAAMARIGEKLWKPLLGLGQEFFNGVVPLIDAVNGKLSPAFDRFNHIIDSLTQRVMPIIDFSAALLDLNGTIEQLTNLSKLNDLDMGIETINLDRIQALKKFREELAILYLDSISGERKVAALRNALQKFHDEKVLDPEGMKRAEEALKKFDKALAEGKVPAELFLKALGANDRELKYFNDIVAGGKSAIEMFKRGLENIKEALKGNTGFLRSLFDMLLSFIALVARGVTAINNFAKETGILKAILSLLDAVVTKIATGLKTIFDTISSGNEVLSESIITFFTKLASAINLAADKIGGVSGIFKKFFETLKGFFGPKFASIKNYLGEFFGSLSFNFQTFTKILHGVAAAGIVKFLYNIGNAMLRFAEVFKNAGISQIFVGESFNQIRLSLIGLQNTMEIYQKTIKANVILKIAGAIAILAGAMLIISMIPADKLMNAIAAISLLFLELTIVSHSISSIKRLPNDHLIKMAITIMVLAAAMKKLSEIENLGRGLTAVTVLLAELTAICYAFSALKIKPRGLRKVGTSLILLAAAIRLLVKPIRELGELDNDTLTQGLFSLTAILAELTVFMKAISLIQNGAFIKAAMSVVILAAAIRLLIKPLSDLGSMDIGVIQQGLMMLIGLLGVVAGFYYMVSMVKSGPLLKAGTSLILIALALRLIVKPIQELGSIDQNTLDKGAGSLAGVMAAIAAFIFAVKASGINSFQMMALATSMLGLSASINIIALAIKAMGNTENVGSGLLVMAAGLGILAGAMHVMKKAKSGALAMVVVAAALWLIVPALKLLSTISLEGALTGLVALAGLFAVISIGSAALMSIAGVIPVLLGFAAAVALLGIGVFALASGITMLGSAIAIGLAPVLGIFQTLVPLIKPIFVALAQGLIAFVTTIAEGGKMLIQAFCTIIVDLAEALIQQIPVLVEAGIRLLLGLLNGVLSAIGQIVRVVAQIIVAFVNALSEKIGDIIDAGFNLLVAFIQGMANGLDAHGHEIVNAILDLLLSVIELLASYIPIFGNKAAGWIHEMREGLENNAGEVTGEASKIAKDTDKNLDIPNQYNNGWNAVQGLIEGLRAAKPGLDRMANSIAATVDEIIRKKNEINSPSKLLARTGRYLMMGLIKGVDSLTDEYEQKADNIATMMLGSTNRSLDNISSIMSRDISPTLNMSKISAIADGIDVKASGTIEMQKQAELIKKLEDMTNSLSIAIENQNTDHTFNFNIPFEIDGRAVARAQGTYTQDELNRIDMLANRKLGII